MKAIKNKISLTGIAYALVQSGYWISLCVSLSCAAVFLQNRGYSNSRLGLVIALGSAGAFFLSPALGGLVDRSERIHSSTVLWVLLTVQGLCVLSFAFLPGQSLAVSVCYSVYIAANTCLVPLITQLCFDMQSLRYDINFGAARGIGSLAFAVVAVWLGALLERRSSEILIPAGLIVTAFQMLILIPFSAKCRALPHTAAAKGESASMLAFIRDNPRFCCLMLGLALQFFTHNLVNNFLINVIRNVGGSEMELGGINSFMAIAELPAMFLYLRLSRRFGCSRCVRFGSLAFSMKALAVALSGSIGALYAAQILQGLSYAVLTPALVEYCDKYVEAKYHARAQAVNYAMFTLGGIFASMLGGIMFDALSVRATLFIGTLVSAAGFTLCAVFSEKK